MVHLGYLHKNHNNSFHIRNVNAVQPYEIILNKKESTSNVDLP
jgi:hypothetical protein